MTGRAADDGKVYAWGTNTKTVADGDDADEDCNDTDPAIHPGEVCGESKHLSAAISGPFDTGGGLRSARADVNVTVVNDPPQAEAGASVLVCPVDGKAYEPSDLSEWGSESGANSETPTIVCQVMVQPPECPVPVRALLYVKRCRSDGQLVYTGGWVLDEAGLFEESVTALTLAGETRVVGVDAGAFGGNLDDDGYGDVISRALSGERARRGARVETGPVSELVEAGALSTELFDPANPVASDFLRFRSGGGGGGGRNAVTHCPLDAPVLHVVNGGSASSEVKFKAGAELSKSVN